MSRPNHKIASYNLKWSFTGLSIEKLQKRDHSNEIFSDPFILRLGESMSEWTFCLQYCDFIEGLRIFLLRKRTIGNQNYKVQLTVKVFSTTINKVIHGDTPIGRCCFIEIPRVFTSCKVADGRLILDFAVLLIEKDIVNNNKPTSPGCKKFVKSFEEFINNPQYSDFTLVSSDNVEFAVHRLVLAQKSKVFDKMFGIEMCEKQENKAMLSDINSTTLQLMLKYIYADIKEIKDVNTAVNVLYACEKYELTELKSYCLTSLMEKVEKNNVLDVLITADLYNHPELEEKCLSIILMHLQELMKTPEFSIIPMSLMLKILNAAHLQKSDWTRETIF